MTYIMSTPNPNPTWRVLCTDTPQSGAWNMAIDEAILLQVAAGASLPTLRLYAWEPACLSLGIAQASDLVDWQALAAAGYDCVRRASGGRGILHTDELTYAICASEHEPCMVGGILPSYRRLSAGLLQALQFLDVYAQNDHTVIKTSVAAAPPVCFEVPSNWEITFSGKKLVGSAQVRKQGAVLQHGSLPLEGDITRICQVLLLTDRAAQAQRVAARACTLADALGQTLPWQSVAQAVQAGFAQTLQCDFQSGELTADELALAEQLYHQKYNQLSYTRQK